MSVRRLLLLALLPLVLVAASSCEVRNEVRIRVDEDGSGLVSVTSRLDAEAARRLGDPTTALRTDDLVAAGWIVDDPVVADDGAVTLHAEREVTGPDQFATALDEVGGVDGVFSDTRLGIGDGFASTQYDFATTVQLAGAPDQFGDPALTAALEGLPLARTPEELAFEGVEDPGALRLEVVVSLPGGDPTTSGEIRDGDAVWDFAATGGSPTEQALSSSSSVEQLAPRVLLGAGLLLLVGAIGLVALGILRRRA